MKPTMKVQLGVQVINEFRLLSGGVQAPTWSKQPTCLSRPHSKKL
jgi:hypothetical protein